MRPLIGETICAYARLTAAAVDCGLRRGDVGLRLCQRRDRVVVVLRADGIDLDQLRGALAPRACAASSVACAFCSAACALSYWAR